MPDPQGITVQCCNWCAEKVMHQETALGLRQGLADQLALVPQ